MRTTGRGHLTIVDLGTLLVVLEARTAMVGTVVAVLRRHLCDGCLQWRSRQRESQ
jgi:hypothetical protein